MTHYKIENFHYSLCDNIIEHPKDLLELRKQFLKITTILWVCHDVEIDPYYLDCAYNLQFPILIFLN